MYYHATIKITVKKEKMIINKYDNQNAIVKSMTHQISSNWISSIYNIITMKSYFVLSYDIKNNFKECTKFAFTFSKHPKFFLGNSRTEIQFNDINLTLSINNWIECKSVINILLNCIIEYYIHTINNLPSTIYFRIKKTEESYEDKLKYFINYILEDESHYIEKELIEQQTVKQLELIPYQKHTIIFKKIITPKNITIVCLLASGYIIYNVLL